MRTFDPWIGNRYATDGFGGKRLLLLGESHYGGDTCNYAAFTSEIIKDMALQKGRLPIFCRIQRLVVGGRGGFSDEERNDFWDRVAFYNFVQTALDGPGSRPTFEMWQAAREPLLQTLRELAPNIVLILGLELHRNLPHIPDGISICATMHPSAFRFCYDPWQSKVRSAITSNT